MKKCHSHLRGDNSLAPPFLFPVVPGFLVRHPVLESTALHLSWNHLHLKACPLLTLKSLSRAPRGLINQGLLLIIFNFNCLISPQTTFSFSVYFYYYYWLVEGNDLRLIKLPIMSNCSCLIVSYYWLIVNYY